ncbi:MAG: hypothetical protein HZC36_02275 [Armatimonadetes bacterium]|nr:hypothetical protein [Armatimonadota bacterium]
MEPEPKGSFVDYPRPGMKLHVPLWVKITIWGSPNRSWVVGFGWFCAGTALLCSILALMFATASRFSLYLAFFAILCALGGVPYFAAVRWLDRNDGWRVVRPPKAQQR